MKFDFGSNSNIKLLKILFYSIIISLFGIIVCLLFVENNFKNDYYHPKKFDYFQSPVKSLDLTKPFFVKPDEVGNIDCSRFFTNDSVYLKKFVKNPIKYSDSDHLLMDCQEIKMRNYFPDKPLSQFEEEFPIAFARIVFTDYIFLEQELASTYAPQNFYCYSIDSKAKPIFHQQIHKLSQCFPNVIYTKKEYNIDASGHNMNFAHYECMKELIKYNWKYLVLLQNHDFAIKTNAEMVQIFKWFNGSNDVNIAPMIWNRIDKKENYTFENLKLFQNPEQNLIGHNGEQSKLYFAKGYVECSLSRAAVDFMVNDLNLSKTLMILNRRPFGVDEILIQTLMATDALNLPGGFTHHCLDKNISTSHFTRISLWYGKKCQSQEIRHSICVFGLADLKYLKTYPHLFANKMMSESDFGATVCWREFLFNRTFINPPKTPDAELDVKLYKNSPIVRFNQEKHDPNFNISNFKC